MTFDQGEFEVRCEWGLRGVEELARISEVIVIVDIVSFSTAVEIATARGGIVFPYPLKGESASAYAASLNASLASDERGSGYSLSPASLLKIPAGYRLVLPSSNGGALAFSANHPTVLAACLRNASAAGELAGRLGSTFAVIPAGELWPTGELRPSVEDLVGAGAVIAALPGTRSPEAHLAATSFKHLGGDLRSFLRQTSSGKELIERGFSLDVDLASELNVSRDVPRLVNRAFVPDGG